ncbi:hypothetical protein WOLCODRAFT_140638 [Wolfiporia cocos MD-104 SS10]|uniref:Uncharacterized protein n=1 Tax=Wolfiporia cocos (strain MD-104) TaxID=742152 RepID=A0A2H3J3T7_WOLCO|nr:hypothetical protein WOLCODRAFT_140638 [Wolfiporia cocos MD-104 SS10]
MMSTSPSRSCWPCGPAAARWILFALMVSQALAAPTHQLVRRDGAGPAAVAIWVPIASVALLATAGAVFYLRFRKRSPSTGPARQPATTQATSRPTLGVRIRHWSSRPVNVRGSGPRELTAEQLAGGPAPAQRNRRRRPGSTASTRSTRSLPIYMKEPGEQEVVVFRGQEDSEDGPRINVVLPPVQEGNEREAQHSIDIHASVMSLAEQDTPLLQDEASAQERPAGELTPDPPAPPAIRASMETVGGASSEERLMPVEERGPAPPYMETMHSIADSGIAFTESTEDNHDASGTDSARPSTMQRNSTLRGITALRPGLFGRSEPSVASPAPPPDSSNNRLSHLLHMFTPGQRAQQSAPPVPSPLGDETRRRSRGATVAGLPSASSPPPHPYRTHRPSGSAGSSSALSAVFRTRSNTSASAADRLRSPSMLSLHSISSPLTHTVVRTELTYPRTGPTPEQMKLIASVDSFKRFGVPYGPDAVAYAASTSRLSLQPPPPVFEEVVRASSDDASGVSEAMETPAESPIVQDSPPPAALSEQQSEPPDGVLDQEPELSAHPEDGDVPAEQPQESHEEAHDDEESLAQAETPAEEESRDSQGQQESPQQESTTKPTPTPKPLTAEDVKKILRAPIPPASFKGVSPLSPMRPGSRASLNSHSTFMTVETFETAEESLGSGTRPGTPGKLTITVTGASAPPSEVDAQSVKAESSSMVTPRVATRPLQDETETMTIVAPASPVTEQTEVF